MIVPPNINTHRITISCEEDLLTLYYFVELADYYLRSETFQNLSLFNEEKVIQGKKAFEFIPRIVSVNGLAGYVVLDDNTIRVTDKVSSHVASCDECDVAELYIIN